MTANLTRRAFLQAAVIVIVLPKTVLSQEHSTMFSIPVLLYHDISYEIKDDYTVTPGRFTAHMEWLYERGYKAISFDDISSASSADKSIIITFDDGYASFISYAFPVLHSYGYKATINIIGQYVNGYLQDGGTRPILSWDEYRYLAKSGLVSLGCHTDRLHVFRRKGVIGASETELLDDLQGFQDRYTQEIGRPCNIIAWPYGFYDDKSISVAYKAGFRYHLTSKIGLYERLKDSKEIPRINIGEDTGLFDLRSKIGAH